MGAERPGVGPIGRRNLSSVGQEPRVDASYLDTDRSIKPRDMRVGDLIVGHHEGDPRLPISQIMNKSGAKGPHPVIEVLRMPEGGRIPGIYYSRGDAKLSRYTELDCRSSLWIIIRDRPGVPRFIEEFPARCPGCKGKVYVGFHEVIHEVGYCLRP